MRSEAGGSAMRSGTVLASLLAWWLIYYNGEHYIFGRAFTTQSLCDAAAENLRQQGLWARCAEIRSW
jgi:hypothetical protein